MSRSTEIFARNEAHHVCLSHLACGLLVLAARVRIASLNPRAHDQTIVKRYDDICFPGWGGGTIGVRSRY